MNQKDNWTEVKAELQRLKRGDLVSLLRDLFELSPDNRNFLIARFSKRGGRVGVETYRTIVVERFYLSGGGFGDLDLDRARKAIADYRKATDDLAGALELMLTFLESGAALMNDVGIHDETFYYQLSVVLADFIDLVYEHPELYSQFARRLCEVREQSGSAGWGYGDYATEALYEVESDLGNDGL
jgi:hypothetical protein